MINWRTRYAVNHATRKREQRIKRDKRSDNPTVLYDALITIIDELEGSFDLGHYSTDNPRIKLVTDLEEYPHSFPDRYRERLFDLTNKEMIRLELLVKSFATEIGKSKLVSNLALGTIRINIERLFVDLIKIGDILSEFYILLALQLNILSADNEPVKKLMTHDFLHLEDHYKRLAKQVKRQRFTARRFLKIYQQEEDIREKLAYQLNNFLPNCQDILDSIISDIQSTKEQETSKLLQNLKKIIHSKATIVTGVAIAAA